MSWIKQDDKLHRNSKARESSDAAFKVWVLSWSYCGDVPEPTGFMSTEEANGFIRGLGKPLTVIKELVARRMWDAVDGGFMVHEFEQGLPSKSTQRVRAWRAKKQLQGVTETVSETVSKQLHPVSAHARAVPEPDPVAVTPDVVTAPEPVPVPVSKAPPSPSVSTATPADAFSNGGPDEPVVELVNGMHAILGHQLSQVDVLACQGALNQYPYMTAAALLDRAREHIAHCESQTPKLPTPRTVAGFSETWASQNHWFADHGSPKAWRPGKRQRSMTSVGQALHELAAIRDPDE